ncbi:MAG: S41 family peptidase [Treponema sp.]|jgi:carboxyl-terminal processing protease|nr:S41 family peptidase [Treponema sp.]
MKKPIFSTAFLWVILTVYLCIFFACASTAPISAQNRNQAGQHTQMMREIFEFIRNRYVDEVDPQKIFEGAVTGMFETLGDPHSNYLNAQDMLDLTDTTHGDFGGVGLYISKQVGVTPAYIEVASPIEDTPAWRANINPGDFIIEVNGVSTDSMTTEEAMGMLRGPVGEQVNLLIRRGKTLEFPVTLARAMIEVPTVKSAMIGTVGYLKLLTFTPRTVERAREALETFKEQQYRSLIVDLRNNYGGLLSSAVGICDLFLDGGLVVSTKSRIPAENNSINARRGLTVSADIPLVVLINKGSASASEIVAGALKDRGRAYLVGEKSYGKGSVQQVFPLDKVTGFKLTIARYYTPSDVNIDKIGIPPDREVLFPAFTEDDSKQLEALITSNRITLFIEENPNATLAQINNFALSLSTEYHLDQSLLVRLIRNEQNRTVMAPVYDLDYDVQLREALNIVQSSAYQSLMQSTKTLKQLQEEAAEEEEMAIAS